MGLGRMCARRLRPISLGIGFAGVFVAQPAFDLWIDDVIVDPDPVTCAD